VFFSKAGARAGLVTFHIRDDVTNLIPLDDRLLLIVVILSWRDRFAVFWYLLLLVKQSMSSHEAGRKSKQEMGNGKWEIHSAWKEIVVISLACYY